MSIQKTVVPTVEKYDALTKNLESLLLSLMDGKCEKIIFGPLNTHLKPNARYRIIEYNKTSSGSHFTTQIVGSDGRKTTRDYSADVDHMKIKAMRYTEEEYWLVTKPLTKEMENEIYEMRNTGIWYGV